LNAPDIVMAITPIVEELEDLGVPYHIGGSVASSMCLICNTSNIGRQLWVWLIFWNARWTTPDSNNILYSPPQQV
jgi:hypothetical protein